MLRTIGGRGWFWACVDVPLRRIICSGPFRRIVTAEVSSNSNGLIMLQTQRNQEDVIYSTWSSISMVTRPSKLVLRPTERVPLYFDHLSLTGKWSLRGR